MGISHFPSFFSVTKTKKIRTNSFKGKFIRPNLYPKEQKLKNAVIQIMRKPVKRKSKSLKQHKKEIKSFGIPLLAPI